MQGSDLLGHQLLLDLVNEHQVIQLKGLTGHAPQQTAATRERRSRRLNAGNHASSSTFVNKNIYILKNGGLEQVRVSFTETPNS